MPEKPIVRKSAVVNDENPPPGFTFLEHIGAGSFGVVKLAKNQSTGEKVAIKIVSKNTQSDVEDVERVYRETFILTTLQNENIIRLHEVVDTPRSIMLVMEYAGGGEQYQQQQKKGRLNEVTACQVMAEILNGVEYCHRAKVTHRDLKLENILLDTSGKVKIADFGLSNSIKFGQKQHTHCGTPAYISPEQIGGKTYSGAAVDIWALGVILFALVSGFLPFEASSLPALYSKITTRSLVYPSYLSTECMDQQDHLLCADVEKRFTLLDARSHPWMVMAYTGLRERQKAKPPVTEAAIRTARRTCQNANLQKKPKDVKKGLTVDDVIKPKQNLGSMSTTQTLVGNRLLKRPSNESITPHHSMNPSTSLTNSNPSNNNLVSDVNNHQPGSSNHGNEEKPQTFQNGRLMEQKLRQQKLRQHAVVKELPANVSKATYFPLARRRNSSNSSSGNNNSSSNSNNSNNTVVTPMISPTAVSPVYIAPNTNITGNTFVGYQGTLNYLSDPSTKPYSALSANGRNILESNPASKLRK